MIPERVGRRENAGLSFQEHILVGPVLAELGPHIQPFRRNNLTGDSRGLKLLLLGSPESVMIIKPLVATVDIEFFEHLELGVSGNTLPVSQWAVDSGSDRIQMILPVNPVTDHGDAIYRIDRQNALDQFPSVVVD